MTTATTGRTKQWAAGTAMATRAVLAGRYDHGRLREDRPTRTHAVLVDAEGWEVGEKTVCGRIAVENLADMHGGDPLAAPTCPECAKRAAR